MMELRGVSLRSYNLELNRTEHMSFLTGQDRTPQFAGQVLPDQTEYGLLFPKNFICQAGISSHKISSLDTNLVSKVPRLN